MPHRSEHRHGLSFGSRGANPMGESRDPHPAHPMHVAAAAEFQRRRLSGPHLLHPPTPTRPQHPPIHTHGRPGPGPGIQMHHPMSTVRSGPGGRHLQNSPQWYPLGADPGRGPGSSPSPSSSPRPSPAPNTVHHVEVSPQLHRNGSGSISDNCSTDTRLTKQETGESAGSTSHAHAHSRLSNLHKDDVKSISSNTSIAKNQNDSPRHARLQTIGSSEADAASALLISANTRIESNPERQSEQQHEHESEQEYKQSHEAEHENGVDEKDSTEKPEGGLNQQQQRQSYETNEPYVPLKKRRKLLYDDEMLSMHRPSDIPTTSVSTCPPLHVSPVSNSSRVPEEQSSPQKITLTASSEQSPSPTRDTKSPVAASVASRTDSYDLKDGECLPETAKIKCAAEITPSFSQVTAEKPHFPSILHNVLTQSEFAGNVIQWLDHGKAWKIIRWDALRRTVLPRYFPNLRDEDGKETGSMDAFLWNLEAWGFKEINDGPDVGAYCHDSFVKGAFDKCRQMEFSSNSPDDLVSPPTIPKKISNDSSCLKDDNAQARSILQVPSLASTTRSMDGGETSAKRATVSSMEKSHGSWSEDREHAKAKGEHLPVRSIHSPKNLYHPSMGWPPMHRHNSQHHDVPAFVNYRSDAAEMAYTGEGWQYYPESPHAAGRPISGACPPYGDPRMFSHHQAAFEAESRRAMSQQHLTTSPRLQSGRGAMRLRAFVGQQQREHMHQQHQQQSSFPVSNRGKGQRTSPACRLPIISSADNTRTLSSDAQLPAEERHLTPGNASPEIKQNNDQLVSTNEAKDPKAQTTVTDSPTTELLRKAHQGPVSAV